MATRGSSPISASSRDLNDGLDELPLEIAVEGVGLHTGARCRVVLRPRTGPVVLRVASVEARVDELTVTSTARATTVEAHLGALRVGTVEHAFAALAGLGVYEGVAISIDGPEMPLLDGGAAIWCAAIDRLRPRGSVSRSRIVRAAVMEVGSSRYEWSPGHRIEVEVRLELDGFDAARVEPEARWDGDADDFRARIATARTFALARDVDEFVRAGLVRHVDATSVVVLAPELPCTTPVVPFSSTNLHATKVLDFIGDAYLHGGPPIGRVRAVRPGHAANQRALSRAYAEGIIVSAQ